MQNHFSFKVVMVILIAFMGARSTSVRAQTTYDFTTSTLPAGASVSGIDVSGGSLKLSTDSSGNYTSDGYIDIPVSASAVSGKNIEIAANFINSLMNGDFASSSVVAETDAYGTGAWLSNTTGTAGVSLPVINADGELVLDGVHNDVSQAILINPGEDYILSYDLDATGLSENAFILKMRYHDANSSTTTNTATHTRLAGSSTVTYPISTQTTLYTLETHDEDDGDGRYRTRIKTPDCDAHAIDDSGLTFTQFDPGSDDCADKLEALWLVFVMESTSVAGEAKLSNVRLELADQIKTEIYSGASVTSASIPVQSSNLDSFYVEPFSGSDAVVRIHFKSHKPTESPTVTSLTFSDGIAMTVRAGVKTADIDGKRLGVISPMGPKSDYYDDDFDTRTLCVDPFVFDTVSCLDLAARYGGDFSRNGVYASHLEAVLNADGTDYDFSLTSTGEIWIRRLIELKNKGIDTELAVLKVIEVKYNRPDDDKDWAVNTSFADLPDPTGVRSEEEQIFYLFEKYARFYAKLFNGSTTYDYSEIIGDTVNVPKFTHWEIFNEDNISDTEWKTDVVTGKVWEAWGDEEDDAKAKEYAEYLADLEERLTEVVRSEIPDAEITFTGLAAHRGPVINTDDLELLLSHLDPSKFQGNNFHPYSDDISVLGREDLIQELWDAAAVILSRHGFDSHDTYFTEYGETSEEYNPYCDYDATTERYELQTAAVTSWTRGYGDEALANIVSRQILSLLDLPAKKIYYYGYVSNEREAMGGVINADGSGGYDCWLSDPTTNFKLWQRDETTGILAGLNEPTVYQATAAAKAYLLLSQFLSESDPVASSVADVGGEEIPDGEYYHSHLFETGKNRYVLALNWYPVYDYVANYMDYMSGVKDHGFTEKRLQDVTLKGFSSVSAATVVSLEDGSVQNLIVTLDATGRPVINGVMLSEKPVLVNMTGKLLTGKLSASEPVDTDGDGLSDDIDPNPSRDNVWHWVNSATSSALISRNLRDGKSYTFVSGTIKAGRILVNGVMDRSKANMIVFRNCQVSSVTSASDVDLKSDDDAVFSLKNLTAGTLLESVLSSTNETIPIIQNDAIVSENDSGTYGICILNSISKTNLMEAVVEPTSVNGISPSGTK